MTLTITVDWGSGRESQHAKAIDSKAPPVTLQIKIALESLSEVPSNMETTEVGIITSPNPVNPSNIALIVSNRFMLFRVNYGAIRREEQVPNLRNLLTSIYFKVAQRKCLTVAIQVGP